MSIDSGNTIPPQMWECPQCRALVASGTYHSCPHLYGVGITSPSSYIVDCDRFCKVLERIATAIEKIAESR